MKFWKKFCKICESALEHNDEASWRETNGKIREVCALEKQTLLRWHFTQGGEGDSVAEHMLSLHEALGPIPRTHRTKQVSASNLIYKINTTSMKIQADYFRS